MHHKPIKFDKYLLKTQNLILYWTAALWTPTIIIKHPLFTTLSFSIHIEFLYIILDSLNLNIPATFLVSFQVDKLVFDLLLLGKHCTE